MTDDDALETVSARFAPGDDPSPVSAPPVVAVGGRPRRRLPQLESLPGQRATLADRTDHATIVLDLRTPMPVAVDAAAGAGEQAPSEPPGFLDGLRVGWNGFVKAATVASAGVGLALPFAWLAVPVVVVVFTRRRRRSLALSDT